MNKSQVPHFEALRGQLILVVANLTKFSRVRGSEDGGKLTQIKVRLLEIEAMLRKAATLDDLGSIATATRVLCLSNGVEVKEVALKDTDLLISVAFLSGRGLLQYVPWRLMDAEKKCPQWWRR